VVSAEKTTSLQGLALVEHLGPQVELVRLHPTQEALK
jgi:hypothetical protein